MAAPFGPVVNSSPLPDDSSRDTPLVRRSLAYCSANDRNVPVLLRITRRNRKNRRPSYRDAETLQCLDYGVRCTGFLCPLFDVPTLAEADLSRTRRSYPSPSPSA